jgi:hypothetical protein
MSYHFSRGACLTSALVMVVGGCGQSSIRLKLVLPNGYRGAFIIYTEQADGVAMSVENGAWTCKIPESGVLKVKGKEPFYRWHALEVAFEDGTAVPIAWENELPSDKVGLWLGGSRSGNMLYDFVGTSQEHDGFLKSARAGPVTVGGIRR